MNNYHQIFKDSIDILRQENRYRQFVDISRICGEFPYAIDNETNEKITVWCSNDYLGMGQNSEVIKESLEIIKNYGVGSGGTRNISGTNHEIVKLEQYLASLHNRDKALTFVSGYVANNASIQSIAQIIPDLIIFSDAKNHASIISGIKNSGAKKHIFRHNDVDHLEELLKQYPKSQNKMIIFESVYSMDGDFGEVEKFVELAKKYNCLTYCDEVHGVGLYGEKGRGYCNKIKIADKIDIIQGTLAKAYGVIGGFVVANNFIIDAIRLNASSFIFSTSLPPIIAGASLKSVKYVAENDFLRIKHQENVKKLKSALKKVNIDIVENESHIVSIKISGAKRIAKISNDLRKKHKIYVQHINYPTVAKNDERLRVTITPLHDDEMIDYFVKSLCSVLDEIS